METPVKLCAGFIIFRKSDNEFQYLLLQTPRGRCHWSPPKGHLIPGESHFEAALRETEEETGFKEEDLTIIKGFERTIKNPIKKKEITYGLAGLDKNVPVQLSHEHKEYKWANFDAASQLIEYNDLIELIKECQLYLQQIHNK